MPSQPALRPNRFASILLYVAVAAAPLPFGSTDPSAIAFWCIWLGLGLITVRADRLDARRIVLLAGMGLILAAYAVALHDQLSTRPWFARPHPIWAEAGALLDQPLPEVASIARNQPFLSLGAPMAAMLALVCGFVVCVERGRARQLLYVIAWSGTAYAIFGILAYLADPTKILWRDKLAYTTVLTATFVNRNTAAAYFGMATIVWLVLLCEGIRPHIPPDGLNLRAMARRLGDTTSRSAFRLCPMFACILAMFMTGSRAGVGLSLLALVLAGLACFSRQLNSRSSIAVVGALAAVLLLVLFDVMGGTVGKRLQTSGVVDWGRWETYVAIWPMLEDRPLAGIGLGGFPAGYPAYRSAAVSAWGVWDRAHNTLLEIAAEMGLPVALLVLTGWCVAVAILIRGICVRRQDLAIPCGALAAAVLATLHSAVDFSLQIPGFAIVCMALVGAGMSQSFPTRQLSG